MYDFFEKRGQEGLLIYPPRDGRTDTGNLPAPFFSPPHFIIVATAAIC